MYAESCMLGVLWALLKNKAEVGKKLRGCFSSERWEGGEKLKPREECKEVEKKKQERKGGKMSESKLMRARSVWRGEKVERGDGGRKRNEENAGPGMTRENPTCLYELYVYFSIVAKAPTYQVSLCEGRVYTRREGVEMSQGWGFTNLFSLQIEKTCCSRLYSKLTRGEIRKKLARCTRTRSKRTKSRPSVHNHPISKLYFYTGITDK